ncbi:type I restriction endonuclease subunit R [Paenibacillus agricola]|uniref:type I restriction endonuclease subunit R n=1 Tax=Paenibacillus agricola TaxID=2716264 RepID=UPI001FB5E912|nr:type I restriction endonuclease subunit R [Paenibacillus agricola]
MTKNRLYESDFEETTIERLKLQGYTYIPAYEWMARESLRDVVMEERLKAFLHHKYPSIPNSELPRLVSLFTTVDGLSVEKRNERFHDRLVKGMTFSYEEVGETKLIDVLPIDWDTPTNNDFVVMNQLAIDGHFSRRPDVNIFVNGLPLVVFELKSPYREDPSVHGAHLQLQHYVKDIPQLFNYNAFVVIADGVRTMHGMPFAKMEYFAEWKSKDGHHIENNPVHSMKTLIEGLMNKECLLRYIQRFIFFKKDKEKSTKIGAKYHQFFGATIAYQEALRAVGIGGNHKIGTIFHSTGSGKSFTMLFLANLLRKSKDLENPTIVLQVDRTDLDEQLFKTFSSAYSFVGNVEQAGNADDLRVLLQNEGGQIILCTIEKFRIKDTEEVHPVLSNRGNIIVIADEAHRTQYGAKGFASNLRQALPNASHVAFTGTPITMMGRDTTEQFGPIIHTYDMVQSVQDGATVKLMYDPKLIPLDLTNVNIDTDFAEIVEQGSSDDALEKYKREYAALKKVVGTPKRLQKLAEEIVTHFNESIIEQPFAKGLIVSMSREICVALYNALKKIPNCPPMEIIMTGRTTDPIEWKDVQEGSKYSHIKNDAEKKVLKERLADWEDPIKICLVVDMFLTGSDFPPMTFLYVDKPMRGHTLIQAIARVNRVFPKKEGGQIVDFIGIAEQLKEATKQYTNLGSVPRGTQLDVSEALILFWQSLEGVRALIPQQFRSKSWRSLGKVEQEDLLADLVALFLGSDTEKDYLEAQLILSKAYKLVSNQMEVRTVVDEVLLYEVVKTQIRKVGMKDFESEQELERKLTKLIDTSLEVKGTIDIFSIAGIEKPDISILDEEFILDVKDKPHVDLRLKLFKQLLENQVKLTFPKNKKQSQQMSELLEKTIRDYHDRVITAADVVRIMVEMRNEILKEVQKRKDLGLSEEEISFYEIIASLEKQSFTNKFIADLVHKVLKEMKKEFKAGWTESHRTDILAKVKLAVIRVLNREKVTGEMLKFLTNALVDEAKDKYKGWPMDA